ncbi:Crp/Fnr family transcriptional regulator [Pedobacter sp. GSP4]|uniref:Crp/Fnr family transcriptional regulator n=1 Tax=Pedobacter sp. GSP4 TaxID=3453716 RepID=UPI003EEBC60F
MIPETYRTSYLLPLFNYLEQYHPLSLGFMAEHQAYCKHLHIKKNKFILSPIDQNASLYFIISGMVRGFVKHGGKEITTWFSCEGEVVGAIFHPEQHNQHSIEYLQALEDCELICIPYTLIESLYSMHVEASIIGRKLLALKYYAASERALLARIPNASDRYKRLQENRSVQFERIPLRHLASYLGMRMETLSRIRNKDAGGNL